jgi:hypothetical protein
MLTLTLPIGHPWPTKASLTSVRLTLFSSTASSSELNFSLLKSVYLTRLCPKVVYRRLKLDLHFVMGESSYINRIDSEFGCQHE